MRHGSEKEEAETVRRQMSFDTVPLFKNYVSQNMIQLSFSRLCKSKEGLDCPSSSCSWEVDLNMKSTQADHNIRRIIVIIPSYFLPYTNRFGSQMLMGRYGKEGWGSAGSQSQSSGLRSVHSRNVLSGNVFFSQLSSSSSSYTIVFAYQFDMMLRR